MLGDAQRSGAPKRIAVAQEQQIIALACDKPEQQSGWLENMETRRRFLETDHHRVCFVFTPKHCSWLNPIENWFAKLQRQILNNVFANFEF